MKDKEIQGMQIRICNACKQYKKCDKELCTMSELVAKELSRFYQPKLLEDSVVLSRAKYEMLVACSSYEGIMCKLKDEYIRGSKETAEKIFAKLQCNDYLEIDIDDFYKFAKQFGVEIGGESIE